MNKKDVIRTLLFSCGVAAIVSSSVSTKQEIARLNEKYDKMLEDLETKKKINAEIKLELDSIEEQANESLKLTESILEKLQGSTYEIQRFDENLQALKKEYPLTEEMEYEIRRAFSLNNSKYTNGSFLIGLAVLDCELYGENQKHIISTVRRTSDYVVFRGINNSDIIIFGTYVNGEYTYYSLANEHIRINDIDTDVEKYFSNIERIPNEEPAVSYEEIKALEDDLNNSNKLIKK